MIISHTLKIMKKKKIKTEIKDLTISLIENSSNDQLVEKNLNQIHKHFQNITNITGFDLKIEYLAAIPAKKGKALGLNHAAQCLLDYKRTVKFLKAIILAIQENQKKHSGEIIKIFYAGCGPYAPFITLVSSFFRSDEVDFFLLEINKTSLESAKKLINTLELTNYVKDYYLADAVSFQVPNSDIFHILISETLDALLYRECYVPILFNLLPQFKKHTSVIPENVIINLISFRHIENNKPIAEEKIGTVLNVREEISARIYNKEIPIQFSDKKFDLRLLEMNDKQKYILDTQVHIYKYLFLDRNESSLTIPYELNFEVNPENKYIQFTYFLHPEIELKINFE